MTMKSLVFCFILSVVEQCYGQDIFFNDLDHQDILREILKGQLEEQMASCSCAKFTCSCCQHVSIANIGLDVCFSGSYLPKEFYISWKVTVNGKTYIHGNISTEHPPLVCAGIPGLESLAKLCIGFNNLKIQNHTFSGCVYIEAKVSAIVVEKYQLGCFRLPPHISGQLPSIKPQFDLDQWNEQPLEPMIPSDQEKKMAAEEQMTVFTKMRIMAKKSIN